MYTNINKFICTSVVMKKDSQIFKRSSCIYIVPFCESA